MWTQYTYINGERKYEPRELNDTAMMKRFAQIMFLKQAGEDIILKATNYDDMFEITEYTVIRILKDCEVVYKYTRV